VHDLAAEHPDKLREMVNLWFAEAGANGAFPLDDSAAAVTGDYPGERPYRFTGGTIKRVAIDISGQPYLDLERQAAAMLARE